MTSTHVLAVALAALAAVLFGLAAVRQHQAVQETASASRVGPALGLRGLAALVRRPGWLVGTAQGVLAGATHVVALALAPITLVQPVGVLAVPVTVVAGALAARRRPAGRQVLGSLTSVLGVGLLTALLLGPAADAVVLPGWALLAGAVLVPVVLTTLVTATRWGSPVVRCVVLALAAAVLFGLDAVLLRTLGHLLATGLASTDLPLLLTSAAGVALALPVGSWAMQSAYLTGPPQAVLCCLTLLDPLTAVAAGRLLLHDGVALGRSEVWAAAGGVVLAGLGVVLLTTAQPAAASSASSR